MPEEIEVPTEHLHESMEEGAKEGGFNLRVALSAALIAVLAAVCALFAGSYANEAMLAQLKASDQWSYYQAKGIKSSVLEAKLDLLKALGRKASPKDLEKLSQYGKDMADIKTEATALAQESEDLMVKHELMAKGVTLFQVAIALSAIAALTRRRFLWQAGLLLGAAGSVFLVLGLR
ncbi:MAG TPA: DUF4337 domain-containing protein [bacterium]|jgi:hypothetical protein|nr:DUF4337 domain-containing protein [bacterium]